ncbi:MAG TPA: SET domain-containing protein-lysine N-methyltransferase [Alcaligenes sp.]|nr:SET domain-containing protein-lysine N-methyltransferase [Alcaligenes sp.]HRL26573.1 SET domain-containing protein-lysine N-methyltransferase [Alcaligenes sp.]
MVAPRQPWHIVKPSQLHGNGVFANRDIPAGTRILQYAGKRLTPEQADAMFPVNPDDPFHTFFFALSNGKIVDGGQGGNDSRWINHSCAPNCEGHENSDGSRVFIVAMRDIPAGQELLYDYSLVIDDEITDELKQNYRCLCGAPQCRGTMIAPQPADERRQAAANELRAAAAELEAELEHARTAPLEKPAKTEVSVDEDNDDKKKDKKKNKKDKKSKKKKDGKKDKKADKKEKKDKKENKKK